MSYPRRKDVNLLYTLKRESLGERIAIERELKRRKEKEKENGKRDKSQFVNRDSAENK